MKKTVFLLVLTVWSSAIFAQNNTANNRILLGSFSRDSLLNEPFNTWFEAGYHAYIPQPEVVAQLKKFNQHALRPHPS